MVALASHVLVSPYVVVDALLPHFGSVLRRHARSHQGLQLGLQQLWNTIKYIISLYHCIFLSKIIRERIFNRTSYSLGSRPHSPRAAMGNALERHVHPRPRHFHCHHPRPPSLPPSTPASPSFSLSSSAFPWVSESQNSGALFLGLGYDTAHILVTHPQL